MKYTKEMIDEIFKTRVCQFIHDGKMKKGLISEWVFTYPNGNKTVDVDHAYPIVESNHDEKIAEAVIDNKIKQKLWNLCGQYTISTGLFITPKEKPGQSQLCVNPVKSSKTRNCKVKPKLD